MFKSMRWTPGPVILERDWLPWRIACARSSRARVHKAGAINLPQVLLTFKLRLRFVCKLCPPLLAATRCCTVARKFGTFCFR